MNSTSKNHIRREPVQKRALKRKNKILKGAKKIFSKKNLNDVTMREIAKASGVGLGTLYDYFPNKTSIIFVLLKDRIEKRLAILDKYTNNLKDVNAMINDYNDEMRKAKLWSRIDIVLFGYEYKDKELIALRNSFKNKLLQRYCHAFKLNGSDWPDDDLLSVAQYLIKVDILNIELQLDVSLEKRRHFRRMTYATFSHAIEMTSKPYKFLSNNTSN
jgi:AcrR family transcriptional regulator